MDEVFYHEPVLLNKAMEYLLASNSSKGSKVYVDCTLGGGGYTKKILDLLPEDTRVIAIDRDEYAIEHCEKVLSGLGAKVVFVQDNFGNLKSITESTGMNKVDGIVMDLGLSSYQIGFEDGFSYQRDTALDMRADKSQKLSAIDVLNKYDETEIARILFQYGELRYSRKIAKEIVLSRKKKKFETTFDLVEPVKNLVPPRFLNSDLSKIFQAVRIEVNSELQNLEKVLADSPEVLKEGGRVVAVSYHSLEDRIVKNSFRSSPFLKILTKKPVEASEEEISANTRARSAKLRAAEKTGE